MESEAPPSEAYMPEAALTAQGETYTEAVVGERVLAVRDGRVNVFAIKESGARTCVAKLHPGAVISPVRGGPPLVAVATLDAYIEDISAGVPADVDLHSGLQLWLNEIGHSVRDSDALAAIADASLTALPAAIGAALAAEAKQRELDDRTELARQDQIDSAAEADTFSRTARTISAPLEQQQPLNRGPLMVVMTKIGHVQGFNALDAGVGKSAGTEQIKAVARASKVRARPVRLEQDWQTNASNPLVGFIGTTEQIANGNAEPVGLIPKNGEYRLYRPSVGGSVKRIDRRTASMIDPIAWEFTVPLPRDKELGFKIITKMAFKLTGREWLIVAFASLIVSLLALVSPALTETIMNTIVPSGNEQMLSAIGIALGMAAVMGGIFSVVQTLTVSRISQQSQLRVQSAIWDRTLMLPATFFRQYSSGDLMSRVMAAADVGQILSTTMVAQILGSVFSLTSFILMLQYSVELSIVAGVVLLITLVAMGITARSARTMVKGAVSSNRIATSWIVQLLSGVSKIRVAGAETRLVAQHQERIRGLVAYDAQQSLITARLNSYFAAMAAIMPAATYLVIYFFVWGPSGPQIQGATYMAFVSAFGVVYGTVSSLSQYVIPLMMSSATMQIGKPILKSLPESNDGAQRVGQVRGRVQLANVSFKYDSGSPVVLQDVSLTVEPGEFVAIVGPTGAGKSTIVRLLLGFEKPTEGQVLLDGRDVKDLDLVSMRQQMGVVLQNGNVTQASILENILSGLPLPEANAWQAAEEAALADDIRAMPMGMQTRVDSATISGGEAQRILLARALVRKPSIVILDEATSALDNQSQAKVTDGLRNLGATRIVVAHRLSTIRDADRIVVLLDGKIVEQGTFDELLDADGVFAELARRQSVGELAVQTGSP